MTDEAIKRLRILLGADTSDYESKMKRSKSGLDEFSTGAKRMAGQVALAFAAVAGAIKSVEGVIKSTQTTTDLFEAAMGGAKEATNRLAQAVATADFSNLWTNLEEAYKAGKKYTEILDEISDRQRSVDIKKSETDLEITRLRGILQLTTATNEERLEAGEKIKQLTEEQFKREQSLANMKLKNEMDLIKTTNQLNDVQTKQVLDYIRNYDQLSDTQLEGVKKYLDELKKLKALTTPTGSLTSFGTTMSGTTASAEQIAAQRRIVNDLFSNLNPSQAAYAQLDPVLNRVVDSQRDRIAALIVEWNNAQTALQNYINTANRGEARVIKSSGKNGGIPSLAFKEEGYDLEEWMGTVFNTPPSVPAVDVVIEGFRMMDDTVKETTESIAERYYNMVQGMNEMTEQFVEGSIATLAEGLGRALAGGDMEEWFSSVLEGFGGFAQSMGKLLIAYGVSMTAFKKAFTNPVAAVVAGAALVAIGAAIKSAASSPSVGSGNVSSPSSVSSGSYSGGDRKYELVWRRAGKDLVAIMKEENFAYTSLTAK